MSRPAARRTWAWNTVAMLLAAVFGFPVYWMLITAVKPSAVTGSLKRWTSR